MPDIITLSNQFKEKVREYAKECFPIQSREEGYLTFELLAAFSNPELIEAFKKEFEQDNWVSVKDSLPPVGDSLWHYKDGTIITDYYNGKGDWFTKKTTHWQPLPAKPKGSLNENMKQI